jgi:UDP-GlcNAc:undecaprenyl-phosphate GlcNAc-1-phosphate transferase
MVLIAAAAAVLTAFAISLLATPVAARMAWRFNCVDVPGRHKAHARPTPLLGGCAIFAGVLLPSLLALSLATVWASGKAPNWLPEVARVYLPGLASRAPQALGILGAAFLLHLVGLLDDRRGLGPWTKLLIELAVAAVAVVLLRVRVLTAAGEAVSITASILWIAGITNAFNFLDNMDGLSAGVAAIIAAALLAAAASIGQLFVTGFLCVILGSLLGFLPFNFAPARIFMGDAGSLVVGFLLAVASCLTTYVQPGQTYYLYGVFVPVVLMAVPLYDMISVVTLRLKDRASPVVGDRRHFSHRLVRRGMSVRTAVLTVYLCAGATALAATLLPRVDGPGAVLIFAQTVGILLIIALLEMADGKGKP